jgi:hypothetical protein
MIRAFIIIYAALALFSLGATSSAEDDIKDMPGYQKFWSHANFENEVNGNGILNKDEFELKGNRLVLKMSSRDSLAKKKQNKFTRPNLWHMRQG